jgi:hypothetical protein
LGVLVCFEFGREWHLRLGVLWRDFARCNFYMYYHAGGCYTPKLGVNIVLDCRKSGTKRCDSRPILCALVGLGVNHNEPRFGRLGACVFAGNIYSETPLRRLEYHPPGELGPREAYKAPYPVDGSPKGGRLLAGFSTVGGVFCF